MKFSVNKTALKETLKRLSAVVESKVTIPILSNIKIEAVDKKLRITATDMDIELVELLDADIKEGGAITLPGRMFSDIVGKMADDVVSVAGSDAGVKVTCGAAKFSLGALPVEDFPHFGTTAFSGSIEMESECLLRLLDRVEDAISAEETRYYLNGVYLEPITNDDGTVNAIRAVATDGHRLALAEEYATVEGDLKGIIIPRKAVARIHAICEKPSGKIQIDFGDNKIRIAAGAAVLQSKLIDGTFPDYNRVIPKPGAINYKIPTVPFRETLELLEAVMSDKTRSVKLAFAGETLTFSASTMDGNSGTSEIAVQPQGSAGALEIGFNASYLARMTEHFKGDFNISMADPAAPTLITMLADPSYKYVIMPLRV